MVAPLFTIALGVSLEVQWQQPFGFPLFGRNPSLGPQLQMMLASENNGSPWTGTVESAGAFQGRQRQPRVQLSLRHGAEQIKNLLVFPAFSHPVVGSADDDRLGFAPLGYDLNSLRHGRIG
jgi:hypothetical protein